MQKSGLLYREPVRTTAVSIGRIFRENREHLSSWYREMGSLDPAATRVIWQALWWSDTEEARAILRSEAESRPGSEEAKEIAVGLAHPPPDLLTLEISRPWDLDALWVSFLVTGDDRYVRRVVTALALAKPAESGVTEQELGKLLLGEVAKWSLTSNARTHPRVLEICRKELEEPHPSTVLEHLESVISEASKHPLGEDEFIRLGMEEFRKKN
jgi:hypothetical protein